MGRGGRTHEAPARAHIAADELRSRVLRGGSPRTGAPSWTSSTAPPAPPLDWVDVDSSNVMRVAFCPAPSGVPIGSVFVEFNASGDERTVYRLDDVPTVVFEELCAAPSVGSYFNRQMRSSYTGDKLVGVDAPD